VRDDPTNFGDFTHNLISLNGYASLRL